MPNKRARWRVSSDDTCPYPAALGGPALQLLGCPHSCTNASKATIIAKAMEGLQANGRPSQEAPCVLPSVCCRTRHSTRKIPSPPLLLHLRVPHAAHCWAEAARGAIAIAMRVLWLFAAVLSGPAVLPVACGLASRRAARCAGACMRLLCLTSHSASLVAVACIGAQQMMRRG